MKISDLLELVLLAAIWGASFLFTRIAAPVLEPVLLIELRVLLAGLALLILSIRCNLLAEIQKQLITLFLVGCLNSAIPILLSSNHGRVRVEYITVPPSPRNAA
jgi:drug/metabolite transporter (DMT)-like permease